MIIVGMIHNHAHFTMEQDADSYVRAWCKKNPDTCQSYIDDYWGVDTPFFYWYN